mgnify:CR=1 FL=1
MSHITQSQRYTISCMLKKGYKQSEIAEAIDKDKSVVFREIQRNSNAKSKRYCSELADRKYRERQKDKIKSIRFTPQIKESVNELIKLDYSPEQVVGILKKEGKDIVSTETLYQYIWKDKKNKGQLYLHLRNQGKRYRKRGASKDSRGIIKNRISIDKRPDLVENRERFGDLEVDLIIGKGHNQAILTINDRASGVLKMTKVKSKEADVVSLAMNSLLENWKPYLHTITSDNGKEFACHQEVAQAIEIDYYFARPYHSWERGSNENLNGLIRQYFTKGSDFRNITEKRVAEVEEKLNNRPRKRFGFESPTFVMNQLLFNSEVAFMS